MERTRLMNILKYEIPQEYQNRSDVLVCHCCTSYLEILAVILLIWGSFSGIGQTIIDLTSDNMDLLEKLFFCVLDIGVGALGVAGGWMVVKYMKNWTVIFHENGIWHRDLMGKIYSFTDAEVKWYTTTTTPKYYSITLVTESKRMWINSYSSNYRQVKELVQQKYQVWECYEETNDEKNKKFYSVKLTEIGNDEVSVIKSYRDMTGMGIKEARDKVVSAPCVLLETSSREDAELCKTTLEKCGAKVTII